MFADWIEYNKIIFKVKALFQILDLASELNHSGVVFDADLKEITIYLAD